MLVEQPRNVSQRSAPEVAACLVCVRGTPGMNIVDVKHNSRLTAIRQPVRL
jgi:hypothetical protein